MARILALRFLFSICVILTGAQELFAQRRTENVVLVTLDGARRQEIFGGLDRDILKSTAGTAPVESLAVYKEYWADTPEERRRKLMPFFWGTLMERGSIAGNQSLGSTARVTNAHWFSYPGYSEILTGEAHDDVIKSNDAMQNPFETVLEFVKRKIGLPTSKVAAFASWGVFSGIVEHTPGAIVSNAGTQRLESTDPLVRQVSDLQFEVQMPWDQIRSDAFTFRLAMAYMKTQKPRLMYLALDETDDWAHDGKYGLVLKSLARSDRYLQELWEWIESDPQYQGKTTIVLTTDHGRGNTIADWRSHGKDIEGAQYIWAAVAGPDTSLRGEWRDAGAVSQNQIAATIARLFGLDLSELRPSAGQPISAFWDPADR